jgi:hypothetical protein
MPALSPMPKPLPFPLPIILILVVALLLDGCVAKESAPSQGVDVGCGTERAEFAMATQALPAPGAPSDEAYWAQLRKTQPEAAAAARQVTMELGTLADAVDRVNTSYGSLKACRLDRAAAVKAELASGTLDAKAGAQKLAAERVAFDGEIRDARTAAGRIAARQMIVEDAAERLVAEAPGIGAKVAKAVAAPPVPAAPFIATQSTTIYTRPDMGSGRIADLRRGQRVVGPGGGPATGWITLTLNDGSLGYVQASVLRPAQPNASALKAAPHIPAAREVDGDPMVALALAARQTLPGKCQAFTSMIDATVETGNLTLTPSAVPVSPSPIPVADAAPQNVAELP